MRTSPLVTVLIDTYNYGQYIEEAIRSVLERDFAAEELEILVVDDGSTDDTAKRLHQFGAAIRYLHKPNGGQASAFNFGLARARGEIVAFLDADDYLAARQTTAGRGGIREASGCGHGVSRFPTIEFAGWCFPGGRAAATVGIFAFKYEGVVELRPVPDFVFGVPAKRAGARSCRFRKR